MTQDVPTAAIVNVNGALRQLTAGREADEEVTEDQLTKPTYLTRLFMRILSDVAALKRRVTPNRIDYEDITVGVGTTHLFPHGFGGRVRWWVVDRIGGSSPQLANVATKTDDYTLVLTSSANSVVTIRVETAG